MGKSQIDSRAQFKKRKKKRFQPHQVNAQKMRERGAYKEIYIKCRAAPGAGGWLLVSDGRPQSLPLRSIPELSGINNHHRWKLGGAQRSHLIHSCDNNYLRFLTPPPFG